MSIITIGSVTPTVSPRNVIALPSILMSGLSSNPVNECVQRKTIGKLVQVQLALKCVQRKTIGKLALVQLAFKCVQRKTVRKLVLVQLALKFV